MSVIRSKRAARVSTSAGATASSLLAETPRPTTRGESSNSLLSTPTHLAIPTNSGVVLQPSPVVMEAPVTSDVVALVPIVTLPVISDVVALLPNVTLPLTSDVVALLPNVTLPLSSGVVAVGPNSLGIAASIPIPAIQSYNRGSLVIDYLNRSSTQGQVAQVIANIRSVLHGFAVVEYISPVYASEFQRRLTSLYPRNASMREECSRWRDWPPEQFISHLLQVFPHDNFLKVHTFLEALTAISFEFDCLDTEIVEDYVTKVSLVLADFSFRSAKDELDGVKLLYSILTALKGSNYMSWFNSALAATDIGSEVTTVADWLFVWRRAQTDKIEDRKSVV